MSSHLMTFFRHPAFLPVTLLGSVLTWLAARKLWRRHRFRLVVERMAFGLPIVGNLLRRLEANSVAAHLALLIKSGLGIDRGLGLCAELVRTLTFRRALLVAQSEIRSGEELALCLQRSQVFPEDVLALVQAGELAGSLEQSLDTAARYCAEQVERTLESALAALEPILVGLLGIAIGAILIMTFVPIFSTLKEL
jgi:type II secretory pathway component PulF